MKYNLLSKKEPPFNNKLVLIHEDGTWDQGYLMEVTVLGSGKYHLFKNGEEEMRAVKYWGIPTPPKEKE
mgnify:CR=1 FL=1